MKTRLQKLAYELRRSGSETPPPRTSMLAVALLVCCGCAGVPGASRPASLVVVEDRSDRPANGFLLVTSATPPESPAGSNFDLTGVLYGDGMPVTIVHVRGYQGRFDRHPVDGMRVPARFDPADPHRVFLQWRQVPPSQFRRHLAETEAAAWLALPSIPLVPGSQLVLPVGLRGLSARLEVEGDTDDNRESCLSDLREDVESLGWSVAASESEAEVEVTRECAPVSVEGRGALLELLPAVGRATRVRAGTVELTHSPGATRWRCDPPSDLSADHREDCLERWKRFERRRLVESIADRFSSGP